MSLLTAPFYPIIYVRGYAMTQSEIDATVSTPYMGFNLGATKVRMDWRGTVKKHIFESPLIRLMKDYGYKDIYHDGYEAGGTLPSRSIIIYRYYEQADSQLGHEKAPSIPEAAAGLDQLILKIRDQVCGSNTEARSQFKVYLVAHSMGGLVCRCLLQNPSIGTTESKKLVDKVFTFATPHNGIEMAGINVPSFLSLWDMNNFNREVMEQYLSLPANSKRVDILNDTFDSRRFFCLIGTNHKDYDVAAGLSSQLAGEMSDGLVKITNATVHNTPRAFVYRSHSGPYGIVNSEEGYQNLTRFLFGDTRVDGILDVEALPLPPSVRKAHAAGKQIRASYFFEATVSPRGAMTYKLTERRKETYSAILRKFDELLRVEKNQARLPFLFSTFLNSKNITVGKSLVFGIDLAVSTTEYEIDGFLFLDRKVAGEYLFRNTITLRVTKSAAGHKVHYNYSDDAWSESPGREVEHDEEGMYVPLRSNKGFKGKLRLEAARWT